MKEANGIQLSAEDLGLINRYSLKELTEEEVYCFPVILCDNETDRDCERFSIPAVKALSGLFVGKTGIFDHNASGKNQTARIYFAETVSDPTVKTRSGEIYTCLKAKAYMIRTDSNADVIKEIEGGIKKEVSVCCSVKQERCSICGADRKSVGCSHVKGSYYNGKLCEGVLEEPTDAYEWSFVAVPAQPNAGVTKSFGGGQASESGRLLEKKLDVCQSELAAAKHELVAEIIRLGRFCVPEYDPDTVKEMCSLMNIPSLLSFKERVSKAAVCERQKSVFEEEVNSVSERKAGIAGFRMKNKNRNPD